MPAEPSAAPVTADSPSGQAGDSGPSASLATLATLPIKGRAPKTGYDRALFGQAWSDDVTVADGHNGCDTRNDILRRDLVAVELKPGTHDCVVQRGTLHDPYTGTTVEFVRGRESSKQVQVDHVVALSDAWQKGAQQWDEAKRRNFANDPINLQATIGSINQQKGDGDAATWLPPNKSYRCTYTSRIVDVKSVYGLWVTQAEHDAIARVLTDCPSGALTAPADVTPGGLSAPTATPPPASASPFPAVDPAPDSGDQSTVYYPNCKAARDAGAAPLFEDQPGYRPGLDGDGDGVACERK